MILFSLCDIPWWLLWLLPLLVALLTWWYWNNKYNKMVADYDGKIKGLNGRISGLEDDLAACKSKRSDLEGDLAVTKGRMREMESEMKDWKAKGGGSKGDGISKGSDSSKGGGSSKGDGISKDSDSSKDSGSSKSGDSKSSSNLGAITSSIAATPNPIAATPNPIASTPKAVPTPVDKPKSTTGKSIYAGLKSDNLQIIEGVGPKMESVLKENGVDSLATLGNKSVDEIQAILNKYGDKYKIIDPKTWSAQARLAGEGNYDGLIEYQKKLDAGKDKAVGLTDSKLEKYLIKTGAMKAFKQDDLKAIEGIGPATDKLLRENGITTWREMANTSAVKIKEILSAAGSRFALGDPTTWPKQAELAADGKFDELREYQDFLDGGKA